MIQNDHELAVIRERLARIERLLQALRKTARPEEWPALGSGYRLEIEHMQGEILDYLCTVMTSLTLLLRQSSSEECQDIVNRVAKSGGRRWTGSVRE